MSLIFSLSMFVQKTCSSTGGNYDSRFDVGKASGTLIVARPLDAEQKSNYNLTVEATDGTRTVSTQVIETLMKRLEADEAVVMILFSSWEIARVKRRVMSEAGTKLSCLLGYVDVLSLHSAEQEKWRFVCVNLIIYLNDLRHKTNETIWDVLWRSCEVFPLYGAACVYA